MSRSGRAFIASPMSAVNNPSAVAVVAVVGGGPPSAVQPSPNLQQKRPATRRQLPPHVDLENLRAVERRARQEIFIFEQNARIDARNQLPLEALPRTQSNVRSVKRTRQWRKEVERILIDKIYRKIERNRELDRLIEIEKEKSRHLKQEIAQVEKLPDIQQPLVQVHEIRPDHLLNDFIATMDIDNHAPPQPTEKFLPAIDFDQELADLVNPLIGCQPFGGAPEGGYQFAPDYEPTLNPKFLMTSASQLPEELDDPFSFSEHDALGDPL